MYSTCEICDTGFVKWYMMLSKSTQIHWNLKKIINYDAMITFCCSFIAVKRISILESIGIWTQLSNYSAEPHAPCCTGELKHLVTLPINFMCTNMHLNCTQWIQVKKKTHFVMRGKNDRHLVSLCRMEGYCNAAKYSNISHACPPLASAETVFLYSLVVLFWQMH